MGLLVWTSGLSVGNAVIDAGHKNLVQIVNDAIHTIGARDCLTLLQELERLEKWLHIHCEQEKAIAQSVGFPIAMLRPAQEHSQSALRHLRDEMESRYGLWSDNTAAYLSHLPKAWMIGHITSVDMPMKPLLKSRDYHFWPEHTIEEGHIQSPRGTKQYFYECR